MIAAAIMNIKSIASLPWPFCYILLPFFFFLWKRKVHNQSKGCPCSWKTDVHFWIVEQEFTRSRLHAFSHWTKARFLVFNIFVPGAKRASWDWENGKTKYDWPLPINLLKQIIWNSPIKYSGFERQSSLWSQFYCLVNARLWTCAQKLWVCCLLLKWESFGFKNKK